MLSISTTSESAPIRERMPVADSPAPRRDRMAASVARRGFARVADAVNDEFLGHGVNNHSIRRKFYRLRRLYHAVNVVLRNFIVGAGNRHYAPRRMAFHVRATDIYKNVF